MKTHEIREMNEDEIATMLAELREEYFKLSFRNAVHKIDNPLQLRSIRREIARCETILKEKSKAAAE